MKFDFTVNIKGHIIKNQSFTNYLQLKLTITYLIFLFFWYYHLVGQNTNELVTRLQVMQIQKLVLIITYLFLVFILCMLSCISQRAIDKKRVQFSKVFFCCTYCTKKILYYCIHFSDLQVLLVNVNDDLFFQFARLPPISQKIFLMFFCYPNN